MWGHSLQPLLPVLVVHPPLLRIRQGVICLANIWAHSWKRGKQTDSELCRHEQSAQCTLCTDTKNGHYALYIHKKTLSVLFLALRMTKWKMKQYTTNRYLASRTPCKFEIISMHVWMCMSPTLTTQVHLLYHAYYNCLNVLPKLALYINRNCHVWRAFK